MKKAFILTDIQKTMWKLWFHNSLNIGDKSGQNRRKLGFSHNHFLRVDTFLLIIQ